MQFMIYLLCKFIIVVIISNNKKKCGLQISDLSPWYPSAHPETHDLLRMLQRS